MNIQNYMCKAIIILLLLMSVGTPLEARKRHTKNIIYFTQGYWGNIFDKNSWKACKDQGYELEPMFRLHDAAAKLGYELQTVTFTRNGIIDASRKPVRDFKAIVVFDCFPNQLKVLEKYPKEKLHLVLWEPPSALPNNHEKQQHDHFSRIYTWRDDLVDEIRYFKIFYPVLGETKRIHKPFNEKMLAVLIATNKVSQDPDELYSERRKVVEFYENAGASEFTLYGRFWDKSLKSYQGIAEDKRETQSNFKFCYCYENMRNIEGYISEKIFNCFEAGCVPIYWGASNINEFIPAGCFIDRRCFSDDEELYQYISNMDEESYNTYLDNIEDYLQSDLARLFSYDHFVDTMLKLMSEIHKL